MILSISQHIYTVLSGNADVAQVTGGRIFPLGTKQDSTYPFITYTRDDAEPVYTKDGMATVSSSCSVMCVAGTHRAALDLAEQVAAALDGVTADYAGFSVIRGLVTGADESYIADAFVQTVRYRYTIISNNSENG